MKIKTLQIHNIASIEDATIDFAGSVLGRQDIFLICGPTGSGKTTILDAICLALFNKTPRMEGSKREVINAFADGDTSNKIQDTTHLVRKNAVDASVILTFEADGHEYTAKWHVYRKGQYKSGAETKTFAKKTLAEKVKLAFIREWTLTIDGDQTIQKASEVAQKIEEVIKMNFDQFCKTTMLAQGDFTKFLSSSSDEKAQILEKLLGTEVYARVGKVINRIANDKNNEMEVLARELANFKFLSDDEKTEKQEEIGRMTERITAIGKEIAGINGKLKWIADSAKAVEDEEKARAALVKAKEAFDAPEAVGRRATIGLWDMTENVRAAIATQRESKVKEQENATKELRLADDYDEAMEGYRYDTQKRQSLIDDDKALCEVIKRDAPFAEMFANVDVICSKHNAVVNNEKFVNDNSPKLSEFDEAITAEEDKLRAVEKQKQTANADIEKLQEDSKAKNAELEKNGADNIDNEISALNQRKTALMKVENAQTLVNNAVANLEEKQKEVKSAAEQLKSLAEATASAETASKNAAETAAKSKELYDKAYLSLDNHAKALRAKLHKGDECPVCGSIIEHLLDEEDLKEALQPLADKHAEDERLAAEASTALANAKAREAAAKATAEKAREDEKKSAETVKKSRENLARDCGTLEVACDDKLPSSINDIKQQIDIKERQLAERKEVIRKLREEIKRISGDIDAIRHDRLTPLGDKITAFEKSIGELKQKKSAMVGAIDKARAAIKADTAEIEQLTDVEWQPVNSKKYFEELKAAATLYANNCKAHDDNVRAIETLSSNIEYMHFCKERIDKLFPHWIDRAEVLTKEVPDVMNKWTVLSAETAMLAKSKTVVAEKLSAANATVNEFKEQHPEVDMEKVAALLSLSSTQLSEMRGADAKLNENHSNAKAVCDEAERRRLTLAESPLDEGDTKESLEAQLAALANDSNLCAEKKGRLQTELEVDAENLRLHGKKKQQLEAKQIEYGEWKILNNFLGGTDGKSFRNVAQSFILSELLDKANAYLANISRRYTLFCHPGTLTIMMRDAYQGNTERTTNTLSGGESFIISLSLALGLSSMQNAGFEVDTLFIDEGFGTLSPEFLDPVVTALKRLNATYGRRVGIISHVDTLKQRIPAAIEVSRHGNSSSRISVTLN